MLSKADYCFYLVRLLYATLLLASQAALSHLWHGEQRWELVLQIRRCSPIRTETSVEHFIAWLHQFHWTDLLPRLPSSSTCQHPIEEEHPWNIHWSIRIILIVHFIYQCARLGCFHLQFQQQAEKRSYYARLYREQSPTCYHTKRFPSVFSNASSTPICSETMRIRNEDQVYSTV